MAPCDQAAAPLDDWEDGEREEGEHELTMNAAAAAGKNRVLRRTVSPVKFRAAPRRKSNP